MRVGRTKGFARHNGGYTDPHDCPKEMFVRPLRANARPRLADPADRPEWACRATPVRYTREELRSLRGLFAEVPDSRRGQGRKHPPRDGAVGVQRWRGWPGSTSATERFARNLDQEELRALGAWRSAEGRWVAPSDSSVCRVMADTDPDALQDVLRRWAAPRLAEDADMPALAADGKRIRGANRNADGAYFETVTLVTHAGRPLASRCCRDQGGEIAALRALLEDVDLRGCVVTLDPPHSTRDTERAIVETHGADYVLSIKTNCPDTFSELAAIDWDAPAVRRHADPPAKGHGRIEARRIAARDLLPGTFAAFAGARQAFRVIRERTDAKDRQTSVETAYGITSVRYRRTRRPRTPARLEPRPLQVENGAATPPWARTPAASAPATRPPTTPP